MGCHVPCHGNSRGRLRHLQRVCTGCVHMSLQRVTGAGLATRPAQALRLFCAHSRQLGMLVETLRMYAPAKPLGEWDADPSLLSVRNGVVDLRTCELRPRTPEDYMRCCAPRTHDPAASPARMEAFVQSITEGGPEAEFLRLILGCAITGETREHKLLVLFGDGRNGKGELLSLLTRAFGDGYCRALNSCIVMAAPGAADGAPNASLGKLASSQHRAPMQQDAAGASCRIPRSSSTPTTVASPHASSWATMSLRRAPLCVARARRPPWSLPPEA